MTQRARKSSPSREIVTNPDGATATWDRPSPRVTLRDVAALAGVSTSTASRVLNGKAFDLAAGTQQRVMDAAQQLRYRPNTLAVGLRKSASRLIGLIIPDISDPYFHTLARGVADTAMDHGYVTIVCNTDRIPERERQFVESLSDRRVDGIIFAGGGVDGDRHLQGDRWSGTPVVTIGPHDLPFPSIGVDNRSAIAAAVLHLLEVGARRVACLGGQPHWMIHQARFDGYRSALERANIGVDPALIWFTDFGYESGYRAVQTALGDGLTFDGIASFNDMAAVGAIEALLDAGMKVPDDVVVIGCDDIPLARLIRPSLSSIAFPLRQFGIAATEALFKLSTGEPVPRLRQFDFRLEVRDSSRKQAERDEERPTE